MEHSMGKLIIQRSRNHWILFQGFDRGRATQIYHQRSETNHLENNIASEKKYASA